MFKLPVTANKETRKAAFKNLLEKISESLPAPVVPKTREQIADETTVARDTAEAAADAGDADLNIARRANAARVHERLTSSASKEQKSTFVNTAMEMGFAVLDEYFRTKKSYIFQKARSKILVDACKACGFAPADDAKKPGKTTFEVGNDALLQKILSIEPIDDGLWHVLETAIAKILRSRICPQLTFEDYKVPIKVKAEDGLAAAGVEEVHTLETLVIRTTYYKYISSSTEFILMAPVMMILGGHGKFSRRGVEKATLSQKQFLESMKKKLAVSHALRKTNSAQRSTHKPQQKAAPIIYIEATLD